MKKQAHGAAKAAPFFPVLLLAACGTGQQATPPPDLRIDPARVAVAGLSSGAYMATQAHLAYADRIHGAALIAGGPYGCANGDLGTALGSCMQGTPAPDAAALAARVRERAGQGRLAPLEALAGDRVLVLHGALDSTVSPGLAATTADLYRQLSDSVDVALDDRRDFAHTLPTDSAGGACDRSEPPYLGRCGFDAAGHVFATLFGPGPAAVDTAAGELRRIDQRAYVPDGVKTQLADEGYLYLPAACAEGEACGLLVVFHGCEQNADSVGEAFVREAGFNRWADAYGVAVLYPQATASFVPLNPKACWDWWGYTGADYDTREGAQLRWLAKALKGLGLE